MIVSDVVQQVGDAAASVGSAIEADLKQAAVVASMGGKFEVDLEVLYGYYGKLTELYHQLDTELMQLRADAPTGDLQCGGAGGRIAGAAQAAEVTAMSRGESGLVGALEAVQQLVAGHLNSLHDNYTAYMQADNEGARVLTAAAHPELASPTSAAKGTQDTRPDGW